MHSARKSVQHLRGLLQAPRSSHSEELAHETSKIVRRGCHQVPLLNLVDSLQRRSPRSAGLTDMSEGSFDFLASQTLQSFAAHAPRTSPVRVYGIAISGWF